MSKDKLFESLAYIGLLILMVVGGVALIGGIAIGLDYLLFCLYNYAAVPLGAPHLGFWHFVALSTLVSWVASLFRPYQSTTK